MEAAADGVRRRLPKAEPEGSMAEGGALLRQELDMDDLTALERGLGCYHRIVDSTVDSITVRCMEYETREFMRSGVDSNLHLTGKNGCMPAAC